MQHEIWKIVQDVNNKELFYFKYLKLKKLFRLTSDSTLTRGCAK